jgi:hypothetical protein
LIQIPLIYLTKWMKNSRSGQYLFWYGLVHGPSLIVCSYLRIDEKVTMMFSRQ